MLVRADGFPDDVVAFVAHGRVTRADYRDTLEPAIDDALARGGKLRFYYELAPDFEAFDAGAMWEDFKTGMEHVTRWEKVALVTDVGWIGQSMRAFGFMIPARVKAFPLAERAAARAWIAQGV